MNRQQMIESAARGAIRRADADEAILPELMNRLSTYRKGDGPPFVGSQADPSMSVDKVLSSMQGHPSYAPPNDDDYEAETKRLVQEEIAKIAPDGDVLKVGASTKASIDREVRAKRQRPEAPGEGPGVEYEPGKAGDVLIERAQESDKATKEQRREEERQRHAAPSPPRSTPSSGYKPGDASRAVGVSQ